MRPGSHVAEREARERGALRPGALRSDGAEGGVGGAVPILASAGDAIVFDKDLLHAGGPNLSLSGAIRYALYCRMRFA